MPIELVATAKILGLNVSSDLKWNSHIDSIIKKAQKRLYSLSQLKRSGLGTRGLVQFFCTCIGPITEYTCPVFRDSLPAYLSSELERVQKRAMPIIFPFCSYNESLVKSNVIKLSDRRRELVEKPFKEVVQSKHNKPDGLLLALYVEPQKHTIYLSIYLWIANKKVIFWIKDYSRNYKNVVANRVSEILSSDSGDTLQLILIVQMM